MVNIGDILHRNCTSAEVVAGSRKKALEAASDLLAEHYSELSARALFDELMSRERLGSTGLGEGVAIPHCRIPCKQIVGAFLKLEEPVDYDAIDDQPVDLLFVLAVPPLETTAHLEVLAALARVFESPESRRRLRAQNSDGALYEELIGLASNDAA
jgi:PTS system nitrogen regulatory IIA component